MRRLTPLSLAAVAAVLAACATNPMPPAELVAARQAVQTAETDPAVLKYAALDLKKATDALARANALNDKGDSLAEIASASYVAQRQAETAMTLAHAQTTEDAMKAAQVERERARADARSAEARQAEAQAQAARADASSAQQQAALAQQQADALQQQLKQLQAQQTDRGMLVTLGDVLFEFGRADIKPAAQDELTKLAAYLKEHPERRVLIEGFTDSVGSDNANLTLSQRRAEAVAMTLGRLGVAPDRIVSKGYGKSFPIADNTTDTNRALNRRVEVYISDNDQPVRGRG